MRWLLTAIFLGLPCGLQATPLQDMLKRYDDCVLAVSLGISGNRYEAAERSFFACQTEEQAIRAMVSVNPYVNVEAGLAARKLRLKSIILSDPH
jgi:hypothetical protein